MVSYGKLNLLNRNIVLNFALQTGLMGILSIYSHGHTLYPSISKFSLT